jgi:flagellar assembly factor FliW
MLFDVTLPLLGFEKIKHVTLEKVDDIFMRLETPDAPEVSFTLINPFAVCEYEFEIPTSVQEALQIDETSNILIYNIVLIQKPIESSVVNFIAPIIFNATNNKAGQYIINDNPSLSVAKPISDFLGTKNA